MNATEQFKSSSERPVAALSGWLMLAVNLILLGAGIYLFVTAIVHAVNTQEFPVARFVSGVLVEALAIILLTGHFMDLQLV